MVRKAFALFAITASLALSACNTVRGAGDDLKSAADSVDEAL